MKRPFTEVEIRKSVGRLKNNKSTEIDDISAEMIKYSPKIVYQQIADIFNEMEKTGNIPDEVREGVLVLLSKPGNHKDHLQILDQSYCYPYLGRFWQFV